MKNLVRIAFLVSILCQSYAQTIQQTIRGQVFDKISKQILPGATVVVLNTTLGGTTDEKGNFRIGNVPPGRYSLKVSFIGYDEIQIPEVTVNASKEVILDVGLQENATGLLEVNILPEKGATANPVSSRIFTIEEVQRFPGNYNDPARLVASYPGVANTNDQANNFSIRGNTPNAMLWRLEGVDIVNPNHLSNAGTFSDRPTQNGGGVNILSMQLLGNSQFLTGAFAPGYGNALSGVMDMRLRKGNNERHEFTAQAGLIGIDLAAEGPLSKQKNASFLVNYRYSFTGLLGLMGITFGDEDIAFQDLAFNLSLPTKKTGNFTVFGFGGQSNNIFTAQRDQSKWIFEKDRSDITYRSRMGAIGLTHSLSLGRQTSWQTAMSLSAREDRRSQNVLSNTYVFVGNFTDQFRTRIFSANTSLQHRLSARQKLTAGMLLNSQDNQTTTATASGRDFLETNAVLLQPYLNYNWQPASALSFQVGVHSSALQTIEPRASFRWNLKPQQSLTLAYGLHTQVLRRGAGVRYFQGSSTTPLDGIAFKKAHHYVLSYQQTFANRLVVKSEAYYQSLFNVPVSASRQSSYSSLNDTDLTFGETSLSLQGKGQNAGLELSAEQFLTNQYYYLLSASLYDSRYRGSDGVWRDTRYNGQYQLAATGGREIQKLSKGRNRVVGINLRGIWQGGFRDTPIDANASKLAGRTVYFENQAFSLKLPDYYRIDLRLSFKKHKPHYTRIWAIDIQNLTSRQNIAFQYFDVQQGKIVTKNQLGIIPILSYRVEF